MIRWNIREAQSLEPLKSVSLLAEVEALFYVKNEKTYLILA